MVDHHSLDPHHDLLGAFTLEEILHQSIDDAEYLWERASWPLIILSHLQVEAALAFFVEENESDGLSFQLFIG